MNSKHQFKTISADKEMTENISDRIRKLLKRNKYTQLQLAQQLKVSKSTVSKWVNGESITLDALYNLSKVFCCTIDYLVNGDDSAPTQDLDIYKLLDDDEINIGNVKYFYSHIDGVHLNGILLTDALNFLIADDAKYTGGKWLPFIDSRFINAWTTFLSIDISSRATIDVYNDDRRINYEIDLESIEKLELVKIIDILKEKKRRFRQTKNFKKIEEENKMREEIVLGEMVLEGEAWEDEQEYKHFSNIADLDNPLPWKGEKL